MNSTVTVRYDLSAAETEDAIRQKLIELGWTPPPPCKTGVQCTNKCQACAEPDDTALLRQALEALEMAADSTEPYGMTSCQCAICDAIAALRERLGEKP